MFSLRKTVISVLVSVFCQLNSGESLFAQSPLDFNVDIQSGCSPLIVSFSTDSLQYNSFEWDFGDGSTSTINSPQHVYTNSGTYNVSLIATSVGGLTDTIVKQNLIIIYDKPVANFSLSSTVMCQQDEALILTNQSSNFSTCYWDFGDGTVSSSINPVHSYALSGTYNISLIVYDGNGCYDSKELMNAITINPKPSGTISTSANSTCDENELFSFSFSNNNVSSYSWSFGDGSTSSLANPLHNYGTQGLFTLSLYTQNILGCSDTSYLSTSILIKANPIPNIILSDSIICIPDVVYAYSSTSNILLMNWTGSNGFSSTSSSPSLSLVNSDTVSIQLNVEYENGCINNNTSNIIALLSPEPSYSMANTFGCVPNIVQFNNLTVGNYSWNWQFGDSSLSSAFSPNHTYYDEGIYFPMLTATDSNGCSGSYVSPGWVQIIKPVASFSSSVISGCEPLKVEFICTTQGVTQWHWKFGDGTISIDANPTHIYNQAGDYDVELIVTDNFGCTDTIIMQDYISVGVEDVQINSQFINGCAPFSVQFSAPNTNGNHYWNFGDGSNSSIESPTHTFYLPGVYTVSYNFSSTSINVCSQSVPIYATYIIGGGIANYEVEQSVCPPYTANFTDSSMNAVAWLWNFGDGTISTNQHPTHIYTNPGYYNVTLTITSADGCSRSVTKNNVVSFEPLLASPDAIALNATLPLNVQFLANSTGATNWYWDFGDGTNSTLENPIHSYTITGPFSLILIISNDTCSRTLNFPNITMGGGTSPLPNDSIVYTQSEAFTGCVPYTIEFNSPIKNAAFYLWLFGTGDSSNLANPTYVYEDPGLYDVTLITIDSIGLSDTIIYPASVNLYGLSARFTTNNILFCNTDSVTVIALDSTASFYQWNFGDGFTSTGISAGHIYNQSDDYFISLRISDSTGCEVFSNHLYASGIQIELFSDKTNACIWDTIKFSTNLYPNLNYTWNFGDGNTSSLVNPQHAYSKGGIYTVTLNLEDSLGCLFSVSEIITITIYEPIADFNLAAVSNNCNEVLFQFTNNSQNAVSWYWQFGDGQTSNLENPTHHYTSYGNFNVSLTVNEFNCSSTRIDSSVVSFNHIQADFSFTQLDECFPVEIQFVNLSQNSTINYWDFGDGAFSTDLNPMHSFNSVPSDSIRLTVSDSIGCVKSISKPMIDFMLANYSVNLTEGCSPLEVELINSSVGYDSLTWLINDSIFSNLTTPDLVLTEDGYYSITLLLHSKLGCTDTLRKDSLIYVSNPIANYTILDSIVCKPAIVDFVNLSENIDNFNWNFGDGSSSVSENPVHIYNENGSYSTSLIGISTLGCADTFMLNYPITVQGPDAKFFLASTNVCKPKTVWYNDSSSFANFWFWDFGDGYTSTLQQPIHNYVQPGVYNVSLIVSDSIGCTSIYEYPNGVNILDYVSINFSIDKTYGCMPLEIEISLPLNLSDSVLIDFGDGSFGSKHTNMHIYAEAGEYLIKFIRINEWGCKDTTYSDTIIVIQSPIAKFSIENGIGCAPVIASIINSSMNLSNAQFIWDLGLTTAMYDSSFQVAYTNSGIYDISLIVINESMCHDTFKVNNAIQAFDNTIPLPVSMDFVSVVDKHTVELQWEKNTELSVDYYNLYRLNLKSKLYELIFSTIGEIKHANTGVVNYFDNEINTGKYKYDYKVQAVTYCNNKIAVKDILPDNSILLRVDSVGVNGIYLSWNKYKQCDVSGYEIYRADLSTGTYSMINKVNSNTLTYLDNELNCPQPYMYFIKALNLCSTNYISESNEIIAEPIVNLSNQKVEIVRSTVVDDKFILTEWLAPALLPNMVLEYLVYRSNDSANFILVDHVPSFVTEFIDLDVAVDEEAYLYKIVPVNICDVYAQESNTGSSILLQSELHEEISKLKWSKYTEWDSGVEKYVIEKMDRYGNWKVLKEVDGNTYQTQD